MTGETRYTYRYLSFGEVLTGTVEATRTAARNAAIDALGAIETDSGWAYRAAETGSWYEVTEDELVAYGAAVLDGAAASAYSLWCAGCGSELDGEPDH